MGSTCKIVIKPTITVGKIPTIVESIIPKLFDSDSVVLKSESIVNDKSKFFKIRLEFVNILNPIVENIIKGGKEVALGLQILDNGNVKIYKLNSIDVEIPSENDSDDYP